MEMMDNPDSMTNEEIQEFKKLIEIFNDLGKSFEAYKLDVYSNNTTKNLSKRFYQEHFIMAGVLEAFIIKNEITFKELNQSLHKYAPKDFLWDITAHYQNSIITKMIRLGLICPIKTDNKYMPKFTITDDGVLAYQQQTYQTLASTSFFNYQTYQLSKRANRMNKLMLLVTILSVVVTVLVTIVTIFK